MRHDQLFGIFAVPYVVQEALYHAEEIRSFVTVRQAFEHAHHITGIPKGVVNRRKRGTICRVRYLRDE